MKKNSWITTLSQELPRLAGAVIGIGLTAIGIVMATNTILKLYIFNFETPSYFNAEEMCQYQRYEQLEPNEKPKKLNAEEKATCITEETEKSKIRYQRSKKESLIDAIAFLAVGIPFWILFWKKKQK